MKKLVFAFAICTSLFASEERPVRVYADVVGDLFHKGHVEFFRKARALGDCLIVGVLSDETVESYKRRPVFRLDERVGVIEGCRWVDEVVADCPLGVTDALLDEYEIDIVVHGDDFDPVTLQEQYGPAIDRGIMRIVPYTAGVSTTEIIERILFQYNNDPLSLVKKGTLVQPVYFR